MPITTVGPNYASTRSGWTNSANAGADDGSYATATWQTDAEGGGVDTPQLSLSSFGLTASGAIVGIKVEAQVNRSTSNPTGTLECTLFKSGASVAARNLGAIGLADTDLSSGSNSDLWGGTWSVSEASSIELGFFGIPDFGTPSQSGTVSLDYARVTLYYEQPNAFDFTDVTGQTISTVVESNSVTITGLTAASPVDFSASVGSSEWRKNGGAWTSGTGTVVNNDSVQVRHNTGAAFNTAVSTSLRIGGIVGTFTTTTVAADTTPDAFDFADTSGVELNAVTTSSPVTITGINSPANVTIAGGEYSKNSGAWSTAATTCNSGDTFSVRGTASGSYSTGVNVTLTVGGVDGVFTITTRAVDTTPNAFTFTDVSGQALSTLVTSNSPTITGLEAAANVSFSVSNGTGHQYSINGGAWTNVANTTISNNQTIAVRLTTSGSNGVAHSITVTIGGVSDTYTATTTSGDTTPDAFTFTDQPSVAASTVATSNIITITGIDASTSVSFSTTGTGSAHEYRKNGGAWTAIGATTVVNNDTLQVRLTAPATPSNTAAITMTVGGVSDSFNVTSAAPDGVPDAFAFTDQSGVEVLTLTTSNIVTITGLNQAASLSLSGAGEYRINGGAWTSSAGSVVNNDTVQVRLTTAATFVTTSAVSVTIGGISDTFSVTTRAPSAVSQYVATFRDTVFGVAP